MTNMIKAVAMLYSEGANVRIPFEVEFHSGFTEADLDDIVREMFPHLGKFGAYGELIEERNKQMTDLEELDNAYAAKFAVRQELLDAVDIVDYELMLASEAYYAELKKTKEQTND